MRAFLLTTALAALTAASPVPQEIDLDMVLAAPDPTYTIEIGVTAQSVSYNTQTIVAAATSVTSVTAASVPAATSTDAAERRLGKRDTCATQPAGATGAPTVTGDTPAAFESNAAFAAAASEAPVPAGYSETFSNLNASNSAYGYLGYTTLQTYDSQGCAAQCNAINGCMAVNIYFERDPSLDPDANDCPDPSPVTMIKCVFWGGPVSSANADNYGQYRASFDVVIAGSNGYVNNTLATPAGYTGPVYLGDAAINAPYDSQGYNTYMGAKIFTAGPFDVQLCADYCTSQNTYNVANPPTDGSPVQTCQFFNTYILYNNTPSNSEGQYCAIYSESWDSSYATNTGQWRGTDDFLIDYSYSFTNSTGMISPNKNGAIHQASNDITYSTLQSYCSSILGYSTAVATVTATTTTTPLSTDSTTTTVTVTSTSTSSAGFVDAKRQVSTTSSLPVTTATVSGDSGIITVTMTGNYLNPTAAASILASSIAANATGAANTTGAADRKRDVSTPAGLTEYPATVIQSACSLVVTGAVSTSTSTTTLIVTTTAAPSVTIQTITTSTTQEAFATVTACPASAVAQDTIKASDFCDATYKESCGYLTSSSCSFNFGKVGSLAACVNLCDYYLDCAGVNYESGGTCILCDTETFSGSTTGNGDSGYVAAVRESGTSSGGGCTAP